MTVDPNKQTSGSDLNAILVGNNAVSSLMSAISKGANPIDTLPSKRDALSYVVAQTIKLLDTPIYYMGPLDNAVYKWFDSEQAQAIQASPNVVDKRRFTEACIGYYLYGRQWVLANCRSSRRIRPRALTDQQKAEMVQTAAEMADAKGTLSLYDPAPPTSDVTGFDPKTTG